MESNSFTVYHGSARKFPPCDSLSTSSSTRLSRRSTIHSGGLLMNKNPRAYWSMAREATTRPTSRWYSKRVSAFCRKVVQNRGPDSGSPVFFLSDRLKGKRRGHRMKHLYHVPFVVEGERPSRVPSLENLEWLVRRESRRWDRVGDRYYSLGTEIWNL